MNATIRNIQLVAALIVLGATVLAFFLEIKEMYVNRTVNLADLLFLGFVLLKKNQKPK